MSLDEGVLRDVEAARVRLEGLEDQASEARAALHQAIRRLHAAGGSMREIATALGMSHQRIHQIIGTEGIVEVDASAVTEVSSLPVAAADAASPTLEDACSFCASPRREADKLLAGPGPVFICSGCVALAAAVVQRRKEVPSMRLVEAASAAAACSFCGNPPDVAGDLAEASDGRTRICAHCTGTCERLVHDEAPDRPMVRRNPRLRCSFCNSSAQDVQHLIAGPSVYICNGCVGAAKAVVDSAAPAKGPRSVVLRPAATEDHPCSFCARRPPAATAMAKGGRGRICDTCLGLCRDIIQEVG